MTQDLENLIKLQEIDLRIIEQELAKEQYPVAVAELKARIAAAEYAKNAAVAGLEQFAGSIADAEEQIVKMRGSLEKSQERLNSIKTNREYDAVHAEIESQKAMLETAEAKKKGVEANVEKYTAAREEAQKEFEAVVAELQPQIDELNAKIGAIDSVIAEIMEERKAVDPYLTSHTRRTYDSIRKKRKNGKTVSLIVGAAKNCAHCFMILRPQLYADLRRGNDFILCENCGSMLVWHE